MKINQKIYNSVTSEPFDVQELNDGVTIELHSLNQNEELFNQYAPQAKFAIWTCANGKNYRLLLEDTYYPRMREFYGRRVNQCMVDFWNTVEKERGKVIKFIFVPVSILMFAILIFLMFAGGILGETGQLIMMGVSLVGFIIVNTIVNKKVEKIVNDNNNIALEKIKNIIGHKRFEELLDEQQAHYDDFFHINDEVNETENVEVVSEEPTEEVVEEACEVNNSEEE